MIASEPAADVVAVVVVADVDAVAVVAVVAVVVVVVVAVAVYAAAAVELMAQQGVQILHREAWVRNSRLALEGGEEGLVP